MLGNQGEWQSRGHSIPDLLHVAQALLQHLPSFSWEVTGGRWPHQVHGPMLLHSQRRVPQSK